jgi:hypothetical protein
MTARELGKHHRDQPRGLTLGDVIMGYAAIIDHAESYQDEERNELCKTCMEECHHFTRKYWPCDNHVHAENLRRMVRTHG